MVVYGERQHSEKKSDCWMKIACCPRIFVYIIVSGFLFLTFIQGVKADDGFGPVRVKNVDIRVDGKLDESIWGNILPLKNWYQQSPNEGNEPSETTEMWLFYDETALYLGARLNVKNTSTIITRTLERDSHSPDQDAIALILDTLNDNRTAYGFIVSPAGVRTDIAIFNDAETSLIPWNTDWNAFWDAAAEKDEDGWSAEMRIPFSSLRIKTKGGAASMGLILWRYIARQVEYDVFPPIPNNWRFSAHKPSQALDVSFEGIKTKHPVYIRPYVLGGAEQKNVLNVGDSDYQLQNRWERDVGLDVKYNLTSNLVLDLTLNTDFAQVEADDEQINLTRFSLFFPEKRTFFQERADLFHFLLPGGEQLLFHSRSIGIVEEQNVPIIGGVRVTGRMGNWEIGFMEMQTGDIEAEGERIPSENFGVLRIKRGLKNDGSYVGGILTSRADFKGNYNFLAAADIDIRLKGAHYFKMHMAQSAEPGSDFASSMMGTLIVHSLIRRGFSYGVSAMHIGKEFNPGLGFLFRRGINRLATRVGYTWFPKTSSFIQNHGFTDTIEYVWNIENRAFETLRNTLKWEILFRSGAAAQLNIKATQEDLISSFLIGDVTIDPGLYRFIDGEVKYETTSGLPFRLGIGAQGGDYYGGWQAGGTLSPSWTLNSHLTLLLEYNYSRAEVANGIYDVHVARFRVKSALNRALSASAFIQYNNDLQQLSTNIRVRYNPAEGVDLYVVYNGGINTTLGREIPLLPRMQGQTILIKFNYTFVL